MNYCSSLSEESGLFKEAPNGEQMQVNTVHTTVALLCHIVYHVMLCCGMMYFIVLLNGIACMVGYSIVWHGLV